LLTIQIVVLAFVVCGSLIFELLRLFPVAWEFAAAFVGRVGAVFR
jgi:Ribosome associated membrane protein RAMP4